LQRISMADQSLARRKIFLSYRRADHPDFVERIRDWFAWKYGRDSVFMDFDTIPPFTRFADFIREKVHECDVLVAIIGPNWLDLLNQRMNDSEEDYVRVEIRLALEEGKPIAPICIKGAQSPRRRELPPDLQPMMDYNVAQLNAGRHFLDNIERTVEGVEQLLARIEMFQSVTQDIQQYRPPEFDVQHAILAFQEAADKEDWYMARDWLKRIRHSGFMPRFYPIEDYETEVRDAIEHLEARRDYEVIRAMVARAEKGREDTKRVWLSLQAFWESHPAYDPDDLASRFRPGQVAAPPPMVVEEVVAPPARPAQAINLAIFDNLSAIDSEAADALFDLDALAPLAHELAADDESLTLEQAVNLGLVAIPENAS
ncbi:MAG: toll/interleukin-1 receptor domain-containing protein, partial [Anaerolineae bacterium]|nr:toll/interleukin-1 receptor domain-containing protein [Anaerolineae bacterium]